MCNPPHSSLASRDFPAIPRPTMESTKVAILGASGYTGMELVRLLLVHPAAQITAATSRTHAGRRLDEVFPRFARLPGAEQPFIEPDMDAVAASGATIAFLALPHGTAAEYATALLERGLRVIDLSADFRLRKAEIYEDFYGEEHPTPELLTTAIYGLPEIRREEIFSARLVASPGCYPTSILLPLIPLLREGLIDPTTIIANSMSGVSGAGRKADLGLLFVECNESVRAYGIPRHRHLSEIEQELSAAAGENVVITFVPHLIPVNNGISTTTTTALRGNLADVERALRSTYENSSFVRLLGPGACPDTKNVTRTNFIDIGWHHDDRTGRLLLLSAEDNLGKGAAGQSVQSFNIMTGLPEMTGLGTV